MKLLFNTFAAALLLSMFLLSACKQSMVIRQVDYSQSIESVLTPNENGVVEDVQHGLSFNILPLQYLETQDTSSVTTNEVRYIRGKEGFYYVTAPNYKNVYVLTPEKGKLKLEKKITVSETGISEPAFNQRISHIQLLNQNSGNSWKLTYEGVQEEKSQMAKKEGK